MLDSEVKVYQARIYGIIDAIGTLGGAFEIVFWVIMLFYGSIRKNLYLLSVMDVLSKSDENHDNEREANHEQHDNIPITRNRHGYQFRKVRDRLHRSTIPSSSNNQQTSTYTNFNMF